jgi:exopolysaccharide biosynthesis polyprenyl glycosylphosphotransferase
MDFYTMLTRPSLHPVSTARPSVSWTPLEGIPSVTRLKSVYAAAIAVSADFLSVMAGTAAASLCWEIAKGHKFRSPISLMTEVGLQYFFFFVVFAKAYQLYARVPGLLRIRDTADVIRISVFSAIAVAVAAFYNKLVVPRAMLTAAWILVTITLLCQKHLTRDLIATLLSNQGPRRRAIIYGTGADARRLYSCLSKSKDLGIVPVAFVGTGAAGHKRAIYQHDYRHRDSAPIIGEAITSDMLTSLHISDIFITQSLISTETIAEVSILAAKHNVSISLVGAPYIQERPASVHIIDNLLITSFHSSSSATTIYDCSKRLFDLIVASMLLVISAPMWIFAAIAVKVTSPGPIFFWQSRVGKNGRLFQMLKFRSMYISSPQYERSPEDARDPRITPAGHFLRKTSLDELPQLWNVLCGDMSLVGPRPEMPYVVEGYSALESMRLSVPQGLTGIWQLSADRRYAIHESIEYDVYYVENRGFFIDLAILAHTALFAMKGI